MCGQGCRNRGCRGCRDGFEAYERFERSDYGRGCDCRRDRDYDGRIFRPQCERVRRDGCCNRRYW